MPTSPIHFVVPSRNEPVELLRRTIIALRAAAPGAAVVLVDDCSDAEAADAVQAFAGREAGLTLCRTTPPGGAGRAMAVGLAESLRAAGDADWICTVEADASVDPQALVAGLAGAADDVGVCFYSRVWRGGTRDFPPGRVGLSRGASLLHRAIRGRGPSDWTLFYRAYRARTLREMRFRPEAGPEDFSWQAWMAHRVLDAGAGWIEVPVRFDYRRHARPMWARHLRHMRSHLRVALAERRT